VWLVMLVMGDGAAASGISSSVDAEGEVASGLAALSGGRVTPRVGTAGPAAAPSAMTCVIVDDEIGVVPQTHSHKTTNAEDKSKM
jgi:hypothetical protein